MLGPTGLDRRVQEKAQEGQCDAWARQFIRRLPSTVYHLQFGGVAQLG